MRRAALAIALVAMVHGGFAAALALGARPQAGEPGVDLATYVLAARALREGSDMYALSPAEWQELARGAGVVSFAPPYRYPPLTAVVAAPLTRLPFTDAFALWSLLSIVAVVLAALCLSRATTRRWVDTPTFVAAALWVPALASLYAGQANNLVVATTAAAMLVPRGAGAVALGLGVALKPLAAPLLVLAVWRRQLALAVVALFVAVALALAGGIDPLLSYLRHAFALSPLSLEADLAQPSNVSLFGAAARALPDAPAFARAAAVTAGAALAAAVLLSCRRAPWPLAVAAVAPATVLVEPVGWYHHASLALLAVPPLWHATDRAGRVVLVGAIALLDLYGVGWRWLGDAGLPLPLATLALAVICAIALRASRAAGAPARV